MMSLALEGFDQLRTRETLGFRNGFGLEHAGNNDFIGNREACSKLRKEDVAAQCVRSWFQHRPKPAMLVARTQCLQRLGDWRRMVGTVGDDRHPCDLWFPRDSPRSALDR